MNPDKINSEVTHGNFGLERVLKEMARNLDNRIAVGNVYIVMASTFANSVQYNKYFGKQYEDGTEFVQPTLSAALSACVDDRNDVIFLAPEFALTVTASNTDLNKDGVSIIGLGEGLARPTFTYGAAAATIDVSADNVSIENTHHIANFDNVACAFDLGAAKDFRLENNTFNDNSASLHFVSVLKTNTTDQAATGLKVIGNRWNGLAVAPNAFISILGDIDRLTVKDNVAFMAATNNVGHFITFAAKDALETEISNNVLVVTGATDATVGVFLTGSGTSFKGVVRGNMVSSLDTTTELIATAGTGLVYFENYYTGTADKSGKLWPVVDAA